MACELDLTLGIGFEAGELDPSWNQAGKPLLKNPISGYNHGHIAHSTAAWLINRSKEEMVRIPPLY